MTTALTGSLEGRCLIYGCPKIIHSIMCLSMDFESSISKEALLALVNISADASGAKVLISEVTNLVNMCVRFILDDDCAIADAWAMVLCNVSRPEELIEAVLDELFTKETQLSELVTCFTKVAFNKKKCHLNYLGEYLFSDLKIYD